MKLQSSLTAIMLIALTAPVFGATDESSGVKVTIVLRGADSEDDLKVLVDSLKKIPGVRVHSDDVRIGFRKFNNRFTTPIVVTVPPVPGDTDVKIGMLAAAASRAETSSRREHPPGVNLILYTDETLQESSISSLRSSLSAVNGVEVSVPGGLGGNLQEGWCWIRLEKAGGAMLKEVEEKARKSGIRFRRVK